MSPAADNKSFAPRKSLRTIILLGISLSVLLPITALIGLGANWIKHLSLAQVEHEGMLLAHTMDSAIEEFAADGDVERIQAYIDRLVALREKNDLEVNVAFLTENGSDFVASNIPDNIEKADEEEHLATLAALETMKPDLFVDVEDDSYDADDVGEHNAKEGQARATDPTHPDYYFPSGSRSLSITTPLVHHGQRLGSVNVKLSLAYLDEEVASLTRTAFIVVGLGCVILAVLLALFLDRKIFRPLGALAKEMYAFGVGEEMGAVMPTHRKDEMGVLRNEFYNMAARIKSAEAIREELARTKAERKERELEARLQQAQKMEALGTLAGGIAHDFNNMLTPIMGFAELSILKLPDDSELREGLDEVVYAASRAQDLVRQILTFSRQSDTEKCALQVGPIVKETLKLLRSSLPANVELRQHIGGNGGLVLGSPTHIHQVVLNLATNASQAMVETGGRLDVGLSEESSETETPLGDGSSLPAGRFVHLTVSDTGPGIQQHVMDRIFEPYFTTKAEGEGTGLGLAMVHGILQEMGGAIVVGTELGKGTTFDAYFPVSANLGDGIIPEQDEHVPCGTEHVLVVDDEEPIARMMEEMLRSLGYTTCAFSRPADALAHLAAHENVPDVILSDVAMPGMTGIEFVKELSRRGITSPVILCSAYTGGINWRTAGAIGIKAILMKPVRRAELAEKIRKVLDGQPCAA